MEEDQPGQVSVLHKLITRTEQKMTLCVCVCVEEYGAMCVKIQSISCTWQVIIPFPSEDKILLPYSQPLPHWCCAVEQQNRKYLKTLSKKLVRLFLLKYLPEKSSTFLPSVQSLYPDG